MSSIIKKTFEVYLDICHSVSTPEFTVVEGDTGNIIRVHMTDSGKTLDFSDCFIQAVFLRSDGMSSSQSSNNRGITVNDSGELEIELYSSSVAPGMVECEIQIFSDENFSTLITSSKFNFHCRKPIFDDETASASPELPLLTDLLSDVKKAEKEIQSATNSANTAAANASLAANQCQTAISAIPDDLTPPFLKTLSGTNVILSDAHKGSKIRKCILSGSCTITRSNESAPVSASNVNSIEPLLTSAVNVSYGKQSESYRFAPIELAGISNFASDKFDLVSGDITYNITSAVFTGSEAWHLVTNNYGNANYFAAPLTELAKNYSALICSHFPAVTFEFGDSVEQFNNLKGCCIMQDEIRIRPQNGEYETLDEFVTALKSWAANGTPLQVYYERLYPGYTNNGEMLLLIPSSESESSFNFSADVPLNLSITYCCDMNIFMNKAPLYTVLRRTNRSELGFEWQKLTWEDVTAAPFLHTHGNIASNGAMGTTENLPVFTGENGVITTVEPSEARELLYAPSVYDVENLANRIPYVSRRILSTTAVLKNIQLERGILSCKLLGHWSMLKEDEIADISPSNPASIIFPQPSVLLAFNAENTSTAISLSGMPKIRGLNIARDKFDLLTGKLEINIASLVLTGDEDWTLVDADAPYFSMPLPTFDKAASNLAESVCTHFECVPYINREAINSSNAITGCCVHDDELCIRPPDIEAYPNLDTWKALLRAHYATDTPITVYYEKEFADVMGSSPIELPQFYAKSLMTDATCFLDVEYAANATQVSRIEDMIFGTDKTLTSLKDSCEYHLGTLEKLTVTNDALPDDHYSVLLYFDSSDSISVSVPASIRWAGGTPPEFLPNKTYEVSIKDGLGKVEVYDRALPYA